MMVRTCREYASLITSLGAFGLERIAHISSYYAVNLEGDLRRMKNLGGYLDSSWAAHSSSHVLRHHSRSP
jgi:hypothetical protein